MRGYRLLGIVTTVLLGCWIALVPDDPQLRYRFWMMGGITAASGWPWFVDWFRGRSWTQRGLVLGPAAVLAAVLLGGVQAQHPAAAWEWATRSVVPAVVIYLAAIEIGRRYPAARRWLSWTLCLGGLTAAVVGLLEFGTHRNVVYEWWVPNMYYEGYRMMERVMSTQSHPAAFGFLMVACLPLALAIAQGAGHRWQRRIALASVVLMGLALPLSFSRGSLIGMMAGISVYGWLTWQRRLIGVVAGAAVVLVTVSSIVSWAHVSERYDAQHLLQDPVYSYRWHRVLVAGRVLSDHPLTGIGLNHFRLRFYEYSSDGRGPITDNMHLLLAAETGGIGCAGWVGFLAALLAGGVSAVRRTINRVDRMSIAALLAATVGMLVNSLTYDTLYWMSSLTLFWSIAGLLMAEIRRAE